MRELTKEQFRLIVEDDFNVWIETGKISLTRDLAMLHLARKILDPYELEDVHNRALAASVKRGINSNGSYEPGDYIQAIHDVFLFGITEPYLEDMSKLPFYNR